MVEYWTTFITVNYNTADIDLTKWLNIIALSSSLWDTPLYNLIGSSNSLKYDLQWAITQANCYCGDRFFGGTPLIAWDNTMNRYQRYGECVKIFYLDDESWAGNGTPPAVINRDICRLIPFQTTNGINYWNDFYVTNSDRQKFLTNISPLEPLYLSWLHRKGYNSSGVWSWYDYSDNEFPLSNYSNWVSPSEANGPHGCVTTIFSDDYKWRNANCDYNSAGFNNFMCATLACHAENHSCMNVTFICGGDCFKEKKRHPFKLIDI